ncbi:MAG: DUF3168 domain-containing protein [Pseudomonadota bacterium]
MSYALSGPLQTAVYDALRGDAALSSIVGSAIYDAVPIGAVPTIYVRLGGEEVIDASDFTGAGAVHTITVSVITTEPGFALAKAAAGAISDLLHDADLTLSRGRLVSLFFQQAKAVRIEAVSARQIDMRFRARVQDG